MFRIITAFDSWHLANGIHCPSVRVGLSSSTLEEAIQEYNRCNYELYHYKDEKGNPFTEEHLVELYNKGEQYIFALDNRIEGYIVIIDD